MDSSTLRRKITILLLGASLLASAATAADLRGASHPQSLQLLARLAAFFDSLWLKNGGSLDPWGVEEGGSLDPNGLNKGGGSLDPDGRPTASGAGLAPWGLCDQSNCCSCIGIPPQ